MGFGPSSAIRKAELSTIRNLERDRDKLSTRSRAIFDKVFVEATGTRMRNPESIRSRNLSFASQGTTIGGESQPEFIFRVTRKERIEALSKALADVSTQLKKGKIILGQQKKMGRRQEGAERQLLKIASNIPEKTAPTFTGRFSPSPGRNVLTIKGGIN